MNWTTSRVVYVRKLVVCLYDEALLFYLKNKSLFAYLNLEIFFYRKNEGFSVCRKFLFLFKTKVSSHIEGQKLTTLVKNIVCSYVEN